MMKQPVTIRAALIASPVGRRDGDEVAQLTRDLEKTIAGNMAEILEA